MELGGIDRGRITAMLAQIKEAQAKMETGLANPVSATEPGKKNFADALKGSLEQLSAAQNHSQQLGQKFVMGDESVNLSDVMIAMQKANISLQTTIQVRNKLVSAYHDIMNMQI